MSMNDDKHDFYIKQAEGLLRQADKTSDPELSDCYVRHANGYVNLANALVNKEMMDRSPKHVWVTS